MAWMVGSIQVHEDPGLRYRLLCRQAGRGREALCFAPQILASAAQALQLLVGAAQLLAGAVQLMGQHRTESAPHKPLICRVAGVVAMSKALQTQDPAAGGSSSLCNSTL